MADLRADVLRCIGPIESPAGSVRGGFVRLQLAMLPTCNALRDRHDAWLRGPVDRAREPRPEWLLEPARDGALPALLRSPEPAGQTQGVTRSARADGHVDIGPPQRFCRTQSTNPAADGHNERPTTGSTPTRSGLSRGARALPTTLSVPNCSLGTKIFDATAEAAVRPGRRKRGRAAALRQHRGRETAAIRRARQVRNRQQPEQRDRQ
jgi:hypothetical protein